MKTTEKKIRYCYAVKFNGYGYDIARFKNRADRDNWMRVNGTLKYSKYHDMSVSDTAEEWLPATALDVRPEIGKATRRAEYDVCGRYDVREWIWEEIEIEKPVKGETLTATAEILKN